MINVTFNIFNTQQEAVDAQAYDFLKLRQYYISQGWSLVGVTSWFSPRQRVTDNKWGYPVCPFSDVTYYTEPFDPSWLPQPVLPGQ